MAFFKATDSTIPVRYSMNVDWLLFKTRNWADNDLLYSQGSVLLGLRPAMQLDCMRNYSPSSPSTSLRDAKPKITQGSGLEGEVQFCLLLRLDCFLLQFFSRNINLYCC